MRTASVAGRWANREATTLPGQVQRGMLPRVLLCLWLAAAGGLNPAAAAPPEGVSGDAWASMLQDIETREYQVSPGSASGEADSLATLQAPNRAHHLRTYFDPQGARVVERSAADSAWSVHLGLAAIGRGEALAAPGPARIESRGNRVEYRRPGLSEWYVNDARGLAQGFLIESAPAGVGDLNLRLATGATTPVLAGDGAVEFHNDAGVRVLRAAGLKAHAADGRALPALLAVRGNAVELRVAAKSGDFPVEVHLLATNPDWTVESDQAISQFGVSLAGAGDVNGDGYADVIVGASAFDSGQADEGMVFVYTGSAAGLSASATWTAESNQAGASFGIAVAGAGDVNGDGYADVLVGASQFDGGQTNEGRAFVYLGSASGLAATPAWTAEPNQAGATLGKAVAAAGDVNGDGYADVLIGAPLRDGALVDDGQVFLYLGSGTGPGTSTIWTNRGNQVSAHYGWSVASAGDVNGDGLADFVIGAPDASNGQTGEGRAFVHHGSTTSVSLSAAWIGESGQVDASYGYSVAGAGDVNGDGYADLVVGAYRYDGGQTDEGRAYVYHGSATGLATTAAWTAEKNQVNSDFAFALAGAGDVNGDGYADVLVAAPSYDGALTKAGRVSLYVGSDAGLSANPDWTVDGDQAFGTLGTSLASAGDINGDGYVDVLVGALAYDNGQTDEGRVYLYRGGALGVSASADWTAAANQSSAYFGFSVASAGDVNGDGYGDVIVGAPYFDNGQTDEGRAFVYHGSAAGLLASASWTAESDQANSYMGWSVAGAGDVNGDGYGDVIVGAHSFSNDQPFEGRVFLYLGSAGGLSTTPAWNVESNQTNAYFGAAVASAGDIDGDGYGDVLVGAREFDNGETDEGRVYLYLGGASAMSTTPAWTAEGDQQDAQLGYSVGSAGDVNGDGYADVIVGADRHDSGQADEGKAFLYYGSAGGLPGTPGWTAESNQGGAKFGRSVGTAGDVNGDGYADVIVGAPEFSNGQSGEGRAFVYLGGASGLSTSAAWSAESGQDNAFLGASVASAGDVDGDGYADVIVGAMGYDQGQTDEGKAFLYLGGASGLAASPAWSAEGNEDTALYGRSVAGAGDVNGDGYADVLVGAYWYENGVFRQGGAFLYQGNRAGRPVRAQQRTGGSSSTPVQAWGLSQTASSFRVSLNATDPGGRGRVKLRVQACPDGVPFGGGGCVSSTQAAWTDVGASAAGTLLTHEITGLTGGVVYHWRARVLYAPFRVTQAGISAPPAPAGGPWRRLNGLVGVADIRTGQPEIAVSGNAVNIADGDTTPSTADHTDFGSVAVSSGTVTRTYTVANVGTRALTLGSLTLSGTHAADFSVVQAPAATVEIGGSTTFQVRFDPGAVGLRSAALSLSNNDASENPFNFNIQGTGLNTPPSISDVLNQTINEDGNSGALAFTVGDDLTPAGSLVLSASSSNPGLVPNAAIVLGGSGANRTVTVTPAANLSGSAVITLTVTDGNSASSSDTFQLTVNPVNDAPSLSLASLAVHPAGTTGVQTRTGFATVTMGPPDEAGQSVADYLIDQISDPDGVLQANSLDIANNGSLSYTLSGVGGSAVVSVRVRDSGGTANGGLDTSAPAQFTVSVTPGADLQIALTNNRSTLSPGEQTLYAIVVANAGPNAVSGATLTDTLPPTLINASWMCVQAQSTANCPSPSAGTGNLNALVDLGVNQSLRFDLLAEVNGAVGALVSNTASVAAPVGTTALNPGNDSATDQDPIATDGLHANGFEEPAAGLSLPQAREALKQL